MKFVFKAKDEKGQVREGVVDAMTQEMAVSLLQKNGLVPVSLAQESQSSSFLRELHRIWEGVRPKELLVFFRQLSALTEAKVPLINSLQAIQEQTENKYFSTILKEMQGDVEDGMTFSQALSKHPLVFSPLMVNMIKAGEVSGNLQKSLEFIATNTNKNYQLTSKIKGALYYPAFVLGIAGLIGFVVISFVLPKLTVVIKEMNAPVPWYTTAVMSLGDFMASYWWAVLLLFIAVIGSAIYYLHTQAGRDEWQNIQLRLPVLGQLFQYLYLARFADNFATLLNAGIPMVRALIIVGDVIGNDVYKNIINEGVEEVKSGGTLSNVFARSSLIPPLVTQMTKIGEETGKLGDVLSSTSSFYTDEVENMARNMTSLIEPVLIVFLGIGVAVMVFSIILPIYNVTSQIQ